MRLDSPGEGRRDHPAMPCRRHAISMWFTVRALRNTAIGMKLHLCKTPDPVMAVTVFDSMEGVMNVSEAIRQAVHESGWAVDDLSERVGVFPIALQLVCQLER